MTLQDVNKFSANPGSVVAGAINGHPQYGLQMAPVERKKGNSAKASAKQTILPGQPANYAHMTQTNLNTMASQSPVPSLQQIRAQAEQAASAGGYNAAHLQSTGAGGAPT